MTILLMLESKTLILCDKFTKFVWLNFIYEYNRNTVTPLANFGASPPAPADLTYMISI